MFLILWQRLCSCYATATPGTCRPPAARTGSDPATVCFFFSSGASQSAVIGEAVPVYCRNYRFYRDHTWQKNQTISRRRRLTRPTWIRSTRTGRKKSQRSRSDMQQNRCGFTVGLALLRLAADDVVAPGGAGVGHLLDAVEEAAEGVVAGGLLGGLDQVVVLGGADVAGLRTKSRRVTLDVEDIICAGGVNICAKAGKHEQLPTTTTQNVLHLLPFNTEYCGQASSAPLYIREVPGSNPGAQPDQMWVFFKGFLTLSHRGMSHITDKANAGSVSNLSILFVNCRTSRPPQKALRPPELTQKAPQDPTVLARVPRPGLLHSCVFDHRAKNNPGRTVPKAVLINETVRIRGVRSSTVRRVYHKSPRDEGAAIMGRRWCLRNNWGRLLFGFVPESGGGFFVYVSVPTFSSTRYFLRILLERRRDRFSAQNNPINTTNILRTLIPEPHPTTHTDLLITKSNVLRTHKTATVAQRVDPNPEDHGNATAPRAKTFHRPRHNFLWETCRRFENNASCLANGHTRRQYDLGCLRYVRFAEPIERKKSPD
ncbi:hypothetical protein GEV33_015199 [Tenebrio molitor]|uniref:Uncharacterized protein n=1 Tax=Tenebrio molitor TaxID=7067 RepID=A0A8J6L602_TENMO|nr:hypothetical protein GEV33_015199 [Tenebrio molitor]